MATTKVIEEWNKNQLVHLIKIYDSHALTPNLGSA